MKKTVLFIFAVLFAAVIGTQDSFAQCGDRFSDAVFTSVTTTSNVVFSPTYNLKMNVYEPTGDTATRRPLIILAHGGSFIGGSKDELTTVDFCRRFAKHGYVTASINYRLAGSLFDLLDSIKIMKEVVRAVQDMKTTIRYFHHDAATVNTYQIDTTQIFIGGESAGAILAIHLAYLNDVTELESYIVDAINSEGGIDGSGGYPQYGTQVRGVINFCGGINRASWIDAGETPIVSIHGDDDGTVPYNHAEVFTGQYAPIHLVTLDGSGIIRQRANEVGVYNDLRTLSGQDHMAHASSGNVAQSEDFVMNFLYPMIDCTNLYQSNPTALDSPTAIKLNISPNPTNGIINIQVDKPNANYHVTITDQTGKTVMQGTNQTQYNLSQLPSGLYLAIVQNGSQNVVQKIILQ